MILRWLYIGAAMLVLVWTTWTAIDRLEGGYPALGLSMAVAPFVWVLICTVALRRISRAKLTGPSMVVSQAVFISLALVGTVFGQFAGLFAGIGFSYGSSEFQIIFGYLLFFVLGLVIALAPTVVVAVLAMFITIFERARLDRETPNA